MSLPNIPRCSDCRQCNRKGKPSISRYSKYCKTHYKTNNKTDKKQNIGVFTNIKNKLFDKRTKYDEEGNMKDLNQKGFRKIWFWR